MKNWKLLTTGSKINTKEDVVSTLFNLRNIDSKNKEEFLNPKISSLTIEDSGILKTEIKKTKDRINKAIEDNEKIIILGDYDVDGICASAILWETVYGKYKNIFPYIPDRFIEGYGLSERSLENVLTSHPDVKLIITVDNGIVANNAILLAKEKGVDVIVTDHHVEGEKKPEAYAIVHTTSLCGAGVAWMLARELGFVSQEVINEKLELACLATVADLVPLTNLNRGIVKLGLEYLRSTKRLGLIELFKTAGIDKSLMDVYHIGYIIGPRLNATGRVSHAMDSLRLICSSDRNFVIKTARILEETNKKRQLMVLESTQHAKLSVVAKTKLGKIIAVHHDSYSEGVVGLISSRLVEEYYRPAFAIAVKGELAKGSARSILGVNIIELLRSVSHTLKEAGGHPMAAGFSLETKNITKFYEALELEAEKIEDSLFTRELKIDMELSFSLIDESLYHDIQELSPFGIGNPQPVFATLNAEIVDRRNMGKAGTHMKLQLLHDGKTFDAVGFGMAQEIDAKIGDKIDIAYTIDLNEWNGRKSLQLKIKDTKPR